VLRGKQADADARAKNTLMGDRATVNRSTAMRGGGVYASLHLTGPRWLTCARNL
jgi:hypothetical protein